MKKCISCFLSGVLWRRAGCPSCLVWWSAGPRPAYWSYLPSASRSFTADWCQWFRKDHSFSLCGMDERTQCLPDQSTQQVHSLWLWRGSENSSQTFGLQGRQLSLSVNIHIKPQLELSESVIYEKKIPGYRGKYMTLAGKLSGMIASNGMSTVHNPADWNLWMFFSKSVGPTVCFFCILCETTVTWFTANDLGSISC